MNQAKNFYSMNILISLCFIQVLRKHSLQRGEGMGSALVVRLLVPGAVLGLWAAGDRTAPCWQYFNSWRSGVAILGQCTWTKGGKYSYI